MTHERRRDPEMTRRNILDAARDLFLEKGFADTSTSEIAKSAGATKSLIHHHFGSKQQLWNAVKVHVFGHYFKVQKEMLSSPGSLSVLRNSLVLYFQAVAEDPNLTRMMCWMYLEQDDTCDDMVAEVMHLGLTRIEQAQQAGEIRADLSARNILISFLALTENWHMAKAKFTKSPLCSLLGHDSAASQKSYLNDLLKLFFEGLIPRDNGGLQPLVNTQSTDGIAGGAFPISSLEQRSGSAASKVVSNASGASSLPYRLPLAAGPASPNPKIPKTDVQVETPAANQVEENAPSEHASS